MLPPSVTSLFFDMVFSIRFILFGVIYKSARVNHFEVLLNTYCGAIRRSTK